MNRWIEARLLRGACPERSEGLALTPWVELFDCGPSASLWASAKRFANLITSI